MFEACIQQNLSLGAPPPITRGIANARSIRDLVRTNLLKSFRLHEVISRHQNVASSLFVSRPPSAP